ncbi:phosphotransferase family protein [Caenimonas sp. SL110]|uniref:phosphotransferase family protein n=1 Tax=Caenimonas sp. SL110 TaxID=1450524 RepID=UPI00065338A1|nr:phosphotransferase family protein [Caenimonas sp. SL110]
MRANGIATPHALSLTRLTGGQSNPTYRVTGADRVCVLRQKPLGDLLPSAHAIEREARVMKALRQSDVPVPEVYAYCDDVSIVGAPFYLMEFLDGRVLVDQGLPGMTGQERAAIYDEMNRVIASLHRVDVAAMGLSDFGKPSNYFARQIARWTRQYRESFTESIGAMDRLMEWLPERIPLGERTAVVHGDYRLDNLVFDHSSARVLGVIDWELATLGHPLADFSYHCMSWHIPAALWRGIGGLDLDALAIPQEAQYRRRYAERTGIDGIDEHWDFYLAFNLFRMAAILQGIARRARDGNAASADAAQTGEKARPLADLAWDAARRYDAGRAGT